MNISSEVKNRNSNFELLKIVSMFLIVLGHIIIHGKILNNTSGTINVILRIIEAILIIHVNSFILVTGYYQSKKKFNLKKVFKLNNQAWFYRGAITLTTITFNTLLLTNQEIFKNFLPIDLRFYWFIDLYLILYCLSPFLNILIQKLTKKEFINLLVTLFVIVSLLPTITLQQFFNNFGGYSITNFIFLYFIGAFIREYYEVIEQKIHKVTKIIMSKNLYLWGFALIAVINTLMFYFGNYLYSLGGIVSEVGKTITNSTYSYDNPMVILGAIAYFMFFSKLQIESKIINKLSSLMFGVYLFHDHPYVRNVIYKLFGLQDGHPIYSYSIFLKIIFVAVSIFLTGIVIEFLRQTIFSRLQNIFMKERT